LCRAHEALAVPLPSGQADVAGVAVGEGTGVGVGAGALADGVGRGVGPLDPPHALMAAARAAARPSAVAARARLV
jgi:hypothetical protein